MFDIVKKNLPFFTGFLIGLITAAVLLMTSNKGDLIIFFSENRNPFLDIFFRSANKLGEGLPYLLTVIIFVFVRFRYSLLFAFTGIMVALVTLTTKSFFNHNRPSVYFRELGIFDQINLIDGVQLWEKYSFPSGHAMSAFAVFSLLAFLFNHKKIFGVVMLLFALSAGLARVYLVQHFLQDVFLGAILGVLIAMSVYYFQERFPYDPRHWTDQSLLFRRKKGMA